MGWLMCSDGPRPSLRDLWHPLAYPTLKRWAILRHPFGIVFVAWAETPVATMSDQGFNRIIAAYTHAATLMLDIAYQFWADAPWFNS